MNELIRQLVVMLLSFFGRSRNVGWDFTLANGALREFPGIATSEQNYVLHGVTPGARRREFVVSTRAALSGSIFIYQKSTKKLIGICVGGAAHTVHGDDDIVISNNVSGGISSTASPPDVSVCEVFSLR